MKLRLCKKLIGFVVLAFMSSVVFVPTVNVMAAVPSGYNLVWSDEFNGTSLDTSKWENKWPDTVKGSGQFGVDYAIYDDSCIKVHDGYLWLRAGRLSAPEILNGYTYNYGHACITTKNRFEPTYGYSEIRYRHASAEDTSAVASTKAAHSCYWLMPHFDDSSSTNAGTAAFKYFGGYGAEVDISEWNESLGNKIRQSVFHRGYGDVALWSPVSEVTVDNPRDWHTYGLEWTPTFLKFYVDGVLTCTYTNASDIPQGPEMLIIQQLLASWGNDPSTLNLPDYLQVDYIRWYQKSGVNTGSGPFRPKNYVLNSTFGADSTRWPESAAKTQTMSNWFEWSDNNSTDASYVENVRDYDEHHVLVHYKGSAYRVYTGQTITNIPNGLYRLKCKYRSGGGQKQAYMEAKDFGGSAITASMASAKSSWTDLTISNINVTNGKVTIGFFTDGNAGNWSAMDMVRLEKQ